jgi:hypothetical protein
MRRLVPLLLVAGCAHSPVRGDIHQRGWFLVETAHIALRTDLDRDDAVAHAVKLERDWDALAHLYGLVAPGRPPPSRPFPVVHLASCSDFEKLRRDVSGFVYGSAEGDVAVTCEDRGGDTLVHELAHIFNHHYFALAPRWADEGLATYYSTLQVDGGRAVLGNFPTHLSALWNHPAFLPSMDELRAMSPGEFYAPSHSGENYFSAWKLVHLLNNTSPARQQAFRAYLAALGRGVPDRDAWAAAFSGGRDDDLASDYTTYQQRDRVNRLVTTYRPIRPPPPRVRRLRPGEIHVLWASALTVEHADQVAAQLDRAREADPEWPALLYWRAVLVRPRDRVRLLRDYVTRVPSDPRGWRALVSARLDVVPGGVDPMSGAPPAALAAIEPDVRQLIEHANDPSSLNLIGWYWALRQKPNVGLNFALRAVQAEPSCGACWDTVGVLYFQAGKLEQAVDAQERAAGIYAERAPPDVTTRLRRYRAALRRRPPAGSAR